MLKKSFIYIMTSLPVLGTVFYFLVSNEIILLERKSAPIYILEDMDRSLVTRGQGSNTFFGDSLNIRLLPKYSIAVNAEKYALESIDFTSAEGKYEKLFPKTDLILRFGKNLFEVHCIYCHGADGKGRGKIITEVELKDVEEGFPEPPDLTAQQTINKSNSRLFHILSAGQNLMFPVSHKLNIYERQALIYYIRELQNIEQ